ncbi:MAG TPA: hypothetical protein VM782_13610, partial [Stellaceae bacterium]|nr:hypothetical protein [Stellaceae bacterium]
MSIVARTAIARGVRNPAVIAIVLFFTAFNATIDFYWGRHAHELPVLAAQGEPIARIFQSFAAADHGYFDQVTKAELSLHIINSTLTQALLLLLLIALLRRWPVRVLLQIVIGSYVAYEVLSYWWCATLGGFPAMDEQTSAHFALFFGGGLPWLLGGAYLAWGGTRIALAALDQVSSGSGARRMAANEKASLWLIAFFAVIAYTLELLWLYHAFDWPTQTGIWATGARYYGMGDRAYWDQPSYFEVGLESFNVFFIVASELWLGYAILRRRLYRWPLELCVGGYLTYSVLYYFTVKIAFPQMFTQDAASYTMLIVP